MRYTKIIWVIAVCAVLMYVVVPPVPDGGDDRGIFFGYVMMLLTFPLGAALYTFVDGMTKALGGVQILSFGLDPYSRHDGCHLLQWGTFSGSLRRLGCRRNCVGELTARGRHLRAEGYARGRREARGVYVGYAPASGPL